MHAHNPRRSGQSRQVAMLAVVLACAATATTSTRTGVVCTRIDSAVEMATRLCICEPCHVCEFKWLSGSCGYIERDGLDLSDGSELTIDQPSLDPETWFLSEQEITDSRGGDPRDDMAVYTTGNDVSTFAATNEFFTAAYDDIAATDAGDRVMLTAWSTDLVPFEPDVDPSGAISGFHAVFAGAVERGADVKILGWANLLEASQNVAVRDNINAIPASTVDAANALFVFDDRVRTTTSSHHQKSMIIASGSSTDAGEQPIAYVGGIDITSDRWDTLYHNVTAIRDAGGITADYNGWLDGHLRIHGPAAKDVAANFLARWNSDYMPTTGLVDDVLDFENPVYQDLEMLDYASSNSSSSLGSDSVQIVRTFSCEYQHYKEFAPHGENSLFQARIKALKEAKNFIYIEDQYFVLVPELLDAILEVMPTIQRLIVVVQPPDTTMKATGYEKYLFDMIAPIQQLYPNKFQLYTAKTDRELYIHTKIVIIDDVYLSIGSANWNRRSMTSDSEIGANVIDSETVESPDGITVLKAARDYRIRKFMEKTSLTYEELDAMTFIEAANYFDTAADDNSTILADYGVEEQAYMAAFTDEVRELVDPQDTCSSSSSSSA